MRILYLPCSIFARMSSVMGRPNISHCAEASRWESPAFFRSAFRFCPIEISCFNPFDMMIPHKLSG